MLGYYSVGEFLIDNIARILALLIALITHEVAHALVAYWNGDPTAKNAGRISLNPQRHFDLVGFFMIAFLRFGYGKPVPINPYNFKRRKLGLFTVAIAGITANLFLSFIFTGIYVMLMAYTTILYMSNAFAFFLNNFLLYMMYINLFLLAFNILPFYPLDGFNALQSFTKYNNPVVSFLRKYGVYLLFTLLLISALANNFFSTLLGQYPYLDILGYYLQWLASKILLPFMKFWKWVFGIG